MEKTIGDTGKLDLTKIIQEKDTPYKLELVAQALGTTIHNAEIFVIASGYQLIMEQDILYVIDKT